MQKIQCILHNTTPSVIQEGMGMICYQKKTKTNFCNGILPIKIVQAHIYWASSMCQVINNFIFDI